MIKTGFEQITSAGRFAVIDYGGSGPDCLLVHGTGQNAAAWAAVAEGLVDTFHVVAFDLRGHGQTKEVSTNAEQYWRDIGPIATALGLDAPVIVGHSTGGYAAVAYVAAGGAAAAVVCVDGFTPDPRDLVAAHEGFDDAALQRLFGLFRYGWRATPSERNSYLEEQLETAGSDWLNVDVDPDLLRSVIERCFVEDGGSWLRRPTLQEIATVSAPNWEAAVTPSRDVYDRVEAPLHLVWATRGLHAGRRSDLEQLAKARPNRSLVSIEASHNVPMQRPVELAGLIRAHLLAGGNRA